MFLWAEQGEAGLGEGEVDEVVEALDLFKHGEQAFREGIVLKAAVGKRHCNTEITWTHLVDIFPVAAEALGGRFQPVFADPREISLEFLRFDYREIFFDIVAYVLAYGGEIFRGQFIIAAADDRCPGLQMKIISRQERFFAEWRAHKYADMGFIRCFVGRKPCVAHQTIYAFLHRETRGGGVYRGDCVDKPPGNVVALLHYHLVLGFMSGHPLTRIILPQPYKEVKYRILFHFYADFHAKIVKTMVSRTVFFVFFRYAIKPSRC